MRKMRIRNRVQHDIEFLGKAFPRLKEQFPDAEWLVGYCQPQSFLLVLDGATVSVSLFYSESNGYRMSLGDGEIRFDSIYAIAEFLGKIAHAFIPIDATAAALEARFEGES